VTAMLPAQITLPPGPAAVPVYVVPDGGEIVVEPAATGDTQLIPWSRENEVVFAVVHDSVAEPPMTMEAGEVRCSLGALDTQVMRQGPAAHQRGRALSVTPQSPAIGRAGRGASHP